MAETFDHASKVTVQDEAVHVVGPDSVDICLTPHAALETARRIEAAAVDAIVSAADIRSSQG